MLAVPTIDPAIVMVVAIFVILDIGSGFIAAVAEHEVKSSKAWIGLFKKLGYVLAMALAVAVEIACLYLPLPFVPELFVPVCVLICLIEIMSILENITRINPDLKTDKFFSIFGSKEGSDGDDARG